MCPEWDALSGWVGFRKPCPGICLWNGTRFPDEPTTGKRGPTIGAGNGMQFPIGASSGNYIPESALKVGCTFPTGPQPETASHSEGKFRDTLSATCMTSHAPTSGRLSRRRHIRFIASSARKEGHLMWPSSCAGLSEQGTLYASAWTDVSVMAQQLAAT